jgi:hypothetical protein
VALYYHRFGGKVNAPVLTHRTTPSSAALTPTAPP